MVATAGVNFNIPQYDASGQAISSSKETRVFDAVVTDYSLEFYVKLFKRLAEIFDETLKEAIQKASAPNPAKLAEFINILKALNAWSSIKTRDRTTGKEIDIPSNTTVGPDKTPGFDLSKLVPGLPVDLAGPVTSTMTKEMAVELERIFSMLRANGFDITSPQANVNSLFNAFVAIAGPKADDTTFVFSDTIKNAYINAVKKQSEARVAAGTANLQDFIMINFVGKQNDLLFDELNLLKKAIDNNQQALSFLNGLQDLMNQKDPTKFVMNLYDLSSKTWGGGAYDAFEQQLNKPIPPDVKFPEGSKLSGMDPNDPEFKKLFLEAIKDPNNPDNSAAFTFSRDVLVKNLDALIASITKDVPPGAEISPLITALNTIRKDLEDISGANPLKQYIADVQAGKEGDFQRHINNAIGASQSFNDTQREKLRAKMMQFEQFVSAANKIIQDLFENMKKIIGGIQSRG